MMSDCSYQFALLELKKESLCFSCRARMTVVPGYYVVPLWWENISTQVSDQVVQVDVELRFVYRCSYAAHMLMLLVS